MLITPHTGVSGETSPCICISAAEMRLQCSLQYDLGEDKSSANAFMAVKTTSMIHDVFT